jgi:hypothetical protein
LMHGLACVLRAAATFRLARTNAALRRPFTRGRDKPFARDRARAVECHRMSQSRTLVVAAIGAGALYLVGAVALGSPPAASDSPARVAAWFSEHQDAARLYAWTATFGTLAFAIVAGVIRGTLPSPSGDIFLLGAAAFIVETAIQAWFWAALALHPGLLQPGSERLVLDIASFWGPILTGATTTMIGTVTVLGLRRSPLIPRWLTTLGVLAFAEQAVETITVFGTRGFTAPGGDMNVLLGAALTAAWLAGLVVWIAHKLSRRRREGRPAAAVTS